MDVLDWYFIFNFLRYWSLITNPCRLLIFLPYTYFFTSHLIMIPKELQACTTPLWCADIFYALIISIVLGTSKKSFSHIAQKKAATNWFNEVSVMNSRRSSDAANCFWSRIAKRIRHYQLRLEHVHEKINKSKSDDGLCVSRAWVSVRWYDTSPLSLAQWQLWPFIETCRRVFFACAHINFFLLSWCTQQIN